MKRPARSRSARTTGRTPQSFERLMTLLGELTRMLTKVQGVSDELYGVSRIVARLAADQNNSDRVILDYLAKQIQRKACELDVALQDFDAVHTR